MLPGPSSVGSMIKFSVEAGIWIEGYSLTIGSSRAGKYGSRLSLGCWLWLVVD